MKKIKLNYFIIPLFTIIVAFCGSYFTSLGLEDWYNQLLKPEWTPSGKVIATIWSFLYLLTTLIVLVFWNKYKDCQNFRFIIVIFIINAFLNMTWSANFFVFNLLLISFIQINLLNLTNILLIYKLFPISNKLSLAMIPYFIWVTIATFLNYFIWAMN